MAFSLDMVSFPVSTPQLFLHIAREWRMGTRLVLVPFVPLYLIRYTVEPLYCGHLGDLVKFPV